MLTGFLHIHSLLRYVLLVMLLISIFKSFSGWFGKKQFTEGERKLNLFTLIAAHSQLVIGFVVYSLSPEVQFSNFAQATKDVRFFTLEHITMMIIAIALITVGYSSSKKGKTDETKYKRVAIFYLSALIIILMAIPWPFDIWSGVIRGWMPGMK